MNNFISKSAFPWKTVKLTSIDLIKSRIEHYCNFFSLYTFHNLSGGADLFLTPCFIIKRRQSPVCGWKENKIGKITTSTILDVPFLLVEIAQRSSDRTRKKT